MPLLWLASFWNIGWKSFSPENPNGHHCSLISHSLFYNMILIGVPWLELPIIYWCYGAIVMLSLISYVAFHSLKYTGKTKANDWTHSSKSFRPIMKVKVPSNEDRFFFFFVKCSHIGEGNTQHTLHTRDENVYPIWQFFWVCLSLFLLGHLCSKGYI